ncbi:MAG TPA: MFS transporter [Devosiaceae bacterium]|jgi:PPP family 3-phenylpropionic acid transporter|nr:MFS transporter [Devosiaceae bacterium]
MRLPSAAATRSPVARASAFYFVFLLTAGVSNPYLAIWLTSKGISPSGIGIINAMPFLTMILLNQAIGRIADKAGDWRSTIVIGSILAAFAPVALFFVNDYLGILVVWVLVVVPFQAIAPVADAATIRLTRRVGAEFSLVRVWGTVGFVIMTIVGGVLLERYGEGMFVPLLVVAGLLRALLSLQLPLFRAPATEGGEETSVRRPPNPLVATRLRQVWRPWFLLPLVGVALLHGSHMMQMAFGALIWQQAGVPASIIGPLWALGPAGEVVVMLFFARLARRFSARHLILVACLVAVVRWIGFALEPPLWGLALLQFSNMLTFGLSYLGVVNFVANWTSDDIAAEAQSFFTVIRLVVQVVALTGFGFLTAQFGAGAFYGASAMAVAGAMLTFGSLLLMPARQERPR